jgi:hypothetical protein
MKKIIIKKIIALPARTIENVSEQLVWLDNELQGKHDVNVAWANRVRDEALGIASES